MLIQQFKDENLAQYSYSISDGGRMLVIDPARNIEPYLEYAKKENVKIAGVALTHSHADFVAGHVELSQKTKAPILAGPGTEAQFDWNKLKDGDRVQLGSYLLDVWHTPGHTANSISLLLMDFQENPIAIFTGDTLFIGDCGRPDLASAGEDSSDQSEVQAKQLFDSLQKFRSLPTEVIVYPGHGAGSLCGKNLSKANSSSMAEEFNRNWALKEKDKEIFARRILRGQPYVPEYFFHCVELNGKVIDSLEHEYKRIKNIQISSPKEMAELEEGALIVDTRPEDLFKKGHLEGAINIPDSSSFESWLGSLISPLEKFVLVLEEKADVASLLKRIGKLGYLSNVKATYRGNVGEVKSAYAAPGLLIEQPRMFHILDVRSQLESYDKKFPEAFNIPLQELRKRVGEIPNHKPVVVHCAGGYRSALGASIVESMRPELDVLDLSTAVTQFGSQSAVACSAK